MSGSSNGSLRKARGIVLESRAILDGDALVRLLPETGQVENFRI
ncbi:DNA repair protein RecO, partial [Leptospira ellisii]